MSRTKYHLVIQDGCPYCMQAQDLLNKKGKTYTTDTIEFEEEELLLEMKKKWNHSTVPMIWEIDKFGQKTFVGGYSELVQYFIKGDKELFHG